jgi:replication factor C subunit 3/5
MRFNQLPESDILAFLRKIRDNEHLNLSDTNLVAIQRQFHSDIRSMINYIQTNQDNLQEIHVITNAVWDKLVDLFRDPACDIQNITSYFREIGAMYYIDPRTIIKNFLYYIVRFRSSEMMVSPELLNSAEHIIHLNNTKNEYIIHYFILKFRAYFQGVPPSPPPPPPATKKRIIKIKKQHVSI